MDRWRIDEMMEENIGYAGGFSSIYEWAGQMQWFVTRVRRVGWMWNASENIAPTSDWIINISLPRRCYVTATEALLPCFSAQPLLWACKPVRVWVHKADLLLRATSHRAGTVFCVTTANRKLALVCMSEGSNLYVITASSVHFPFVQSNSLRSFLINN